MRVARLFGFLLLPAALVAGGCTSDVPRASGSAAPVIGAPAPSPTTEPTTAPTKAPTTAPTSRPTKTTSARAELRLGPAGWGALRLGMTFRQASATGLVEPWRGQDGSPCRYSFLRAAPAEKGNVTGSDLGVVAIDAYGDMRTPQGIGLGSTRAAMQRTYPEWESVGEEDPEADGRGFAEVPGNSAATYRIVTAGGRVTELTLQLKTQNCYE